MISRAGTFAICRGFGELQGFCLACSPDPKPLDHKFGSRTKLSRLKHRNQLGYSSRRSGQCANEQYCGPFIP
jgi:hypothetical protein